MDEKPVDEKPVDEPKSGGRPAATRWAAVAIACGIVLAAFPDIVFFGASFRNSRVLRMFESRPASRALIPEEDDREIWDGYRDTGAAAWQLEPAHRFLRRCMVEGESPYWNPFNGSGTHGPERLASSMFSVLTVATAALGAGSRALHAVLLSAFVLAVYCLYRSLTLFLGCSALAATAGCFAFLLTGFHTSMIGAQMLHPYILAPILLLAMLALVNAPTPARLLRAVLASSLLLAETFLPTTLLTMICVHGLCLAYGFRRWRRPFGDGARQLAIQGAASVLGLLLLAPLVFPVLESLPLSEWNERRAGIARPRAALSLATPKHFWESYTAFRRTRGFDNAALHISRIETHRIYHLGVAALLVAFQAFAGRRSRRNPVVLTAGLLMAVAVARQFGLIPPELVEQLPIFSMISDQYWGAMVCFPFCILLAHGVDALSSETVRRWPTFAVLGFLGACFFFLLGRLGFADAGPARLHLRVLVGLIAAVVLAFALLRCRPRSRPVVATLLVAMIAGELIFYMNRLRPVRGEPDFAAIGWVEFLRTHLDDARVLTIGSKGLYPNWGSALAIPQIDSLDGVNLRWYGEFFDRRFGKTWHFLALRRQRGKDSPKQLAKFDFDALDLLGVRYVLVSTGNYRAFFVRRGFERVFKERGLSIFENPDPYPRAFVAGTLLEAPGIPSDRGLPGRQLALTTDRGLLDAASELGISSRPLPDPEAPGQGAGTVEIAEYHHARVVLEASLARSAVVVLTDTWHPSWRVRIDGEPAHLGRVDGVLRGVAVPAGGHRIVMTYSPRSLPSAIVVSFALAAFLSWRVWAARARQKPALEVTEESRE